MILKAVNANCNNPIMQPPETNNDSENFGSFPHVSEAFRTLPKGSERKENHILTVHQSARLFEDAGVARTERSITNWCQPDKNGISRLDCYFDPNERKYFVTPESVDRAIQEERAKITSDDLPHASEPFRNVRNVSETANPKERHTESRGEEEESLAELRAQNRTLSIQNQMNTAYIERLELEREKFVPLLLDLSKQIGSLETDNKYLATENRRLLGAPQRITEVDDAALKEEEPQEQTV
jgi:hypothetical protein